MQLISFRVGNEDFGLDIGRVQEIIRIQQLTRVPDSPDFVSGVISLRGHVIPVIALRKRFGLEEVDSDKDTRILVTEINGDVFGFIVDSVSEVLHIPAEMVEPLPRLGGSERELVSGVGKLETGLVMLIDVDQLMSSPAREKAS
jgi:purine-binding chemotaxis protein CheW